MKSSYSIVLIALSLTMFLSCGQDTPESVFKAYINAIKERDGEKAWHLLSTDSKFSIDEGYKELKEFASDNSEGAKNIRKLIYGCLNGKDLFISGITDDKTVEAAKTVQLVNVQTYEEWSKITVRQTVDEKEKETKWYLVREKGKWRIDTTGDTQKNDPEFIEESKKAKEKADLEELKENQEEKVIDGMSWGIKNGVTFYKPGDRIPLEDMPNTFSTNDDEIKKRTAIRNKYRLLWLTAYGKLDIEYQYWEQTYENLLKMTSNMPYYIKDKVEYDVKNGFKKTIDITVMCNEINDKNIIEYFNKKEYWKMIDEKGNIYNPKYALDNGSILNRLFINISFKNISNGKNPKKMKLIYEGPLGKKGFEWNFKQ